MEPITRRIQILYVLFALMEVLLNLYIRALKTSYFKLGEKESEMNFWPYMSSLHIAKSGNTPGHWQLTHGGSTLLVIHLMVTRATIISPNNDFIGLIVATKIFPLHVLHAIKLHYTFSRQLKR